MEEELKNNPITSSQNGVVVDDEDDDTPTLSSETLAALKEFLAEQNGPPVNAEDEEEKEKEVALVTEDWRLSQFWYDRDTAETVAHEVLTLSQSSQSQSDFRVACIACPTLYAYLKVFLSLSLSLYWLCSICSLFKFC